MREYIDHNDVANTVSMLMMSFKGTVVVVEGNTDDRLYNKFLDPENTETVVAQSKSNVKRSIRELLKRKIRDIIGIVDADLDHLMGKEQEENIFCTDTRDSESLMFYSPAFDSLMSEYADRSRLRDFSERHGDIRDRISECCYPVGMLMLVSNKKGMDLRFKDMDFTSFVDSRTLRCDLRKMVSHVAYQSNLPRREEQPLWEALKRERERDPKIVCRGHDIAQVTAIALRNIIGSYNSRSISASQVAGGLRLSYDYPMFRSTELYRRSGAWARKHDLKLWRSEL